MPSVQGCPTRAGMSPGVSGGKYWIVPAFGPPVYLHVVVISAASTGGGLDGNKVRQLASKAAPSAPTRPIMATKTCTRLDLSHGDRRHEASPVRFSVLVEDDIYCSIAPSNCHLPGEARLPR